MAPTVGGILQERPPPVKATRGIRCRSASGFHLSASGTCLRDDSPRAPPALVRLATALRAAPAPFLDRVPFRSRDGVQFVEIVRVTHFIARDRLTHAVTATGAHVVDDGLADLEAKLDPAKFVRIHRSALRLGM